MKKLWIMFFIVALLCGCATESGVVEVPQREMSVELNYEPKSEVVVTVLSEEASVDYAEVEEISEETASDTQSYELIGNINTKKFHLPSCYALPYPKNRVFFENAEEAKDVGYKPCQKCRP